MWRNADIRLVPSAVIGVRPSSDTAGAVRFAVICFCWPTVFTLVPEKRLLSGSLLNE
jgi:hypothetical protein